VHNFLLVYVYMSTDLRKKLLWSNLQLQTTIPQESLVKSNGISETSWSHDLHKSSVPSLERRYFEHL
jgi:hypothetical protein